MPCRDGEKLVSEKSAGCLSDQQGCHLFSLISITHIVQHLGYHLQNVSINRNMECHVYEYGGDYIFSKGDRLSDSKEWYMSIMPLQLCKARRRIDALILE